MNIVIPMAGMGKRMRPHTLVIPKPLFKIAGKSIIERLIIELKNCVEEQIDEIGFVIGDFGKQTEEYLLKLADNIGAKGRIFYQHEPLGTAHAVYQANEILQGKCLVAFADTLFKTNHKLVAGDNNIIWTYSVKDPSAYGVVKENSDGIITDFIEKPKNFVSDKAIIGIYYFAKAETLRDDIKGLIEDNISVGGEFQLTTSLENLKNDKQVFNTYSIDEWYDCGNWTETIKTAKSILHNNGTYISKNTKLINTTVIEPVYIGNNATIKNSIIGPNTVLERDTQINDAIIRGSIVGEKSVISGTIFEDSIIGKEVKLQNELKKLNIGDYSKIY